MEKALCFSIPACNVRLLEKEKANFLVTERESSSTMAAFQSATQAHLVEPVPFNTEAESLPGFSPSPVSTCIFMFLFNCHYHD